VFSNTKFNPYEGFQMSSFGRSVIAQVGSGNRVSVDGRPDYKVGGVTLDWSSVAAVSGSAVTLDDGITIAIGEKYLPRGQVITKISNGQIFTITVTAGSGNVTVTIGGQVATFAYNANASTIQTAIRGLSTVGSGNATVTGTGPFTVALASSLAQMSVTASGADIAETSAGDREDLYGPYDPAAVDGRATLANGSAFIINETIREGDIKSDHPVAIFGGQVWKDRLKATSGSHSLANGPTFTELLAVMPRLQFVS
jgi:hypothetical protein